MRTILVLALCAGLWACEDSDDDSTGDDMGSAMTGETGNGTDNGAGNGQLPEAPQDRLPISDECNADPCCFEGANYDPAMCTDPFGVNDGQDAGAADAG